MRGWWERLPDRWQRELDAFTAAGWDYRVDSSWVSAGVIGVQLGSTYRRTGLPGADPDKPVRLQVRYPAAYPFFDPEVSDPGHLFGNIRHRHPINRVLCLWHGPWQPNLTAADLITGQLPRLLTAADTAVPAAGELAAPEPVGHLLVEAGSRIVVDPGWTIPPTSSRGTLLVRFNYLQSNLLGPGIVEQVFAKDLHASGFPDQLVAQFRHLTIGRWLRWDRFRPGLTADQVWSQIEPHLPPLAEVHGTRPPFQVRPGTLDVVGLLVPSELRYREPGGEEWLFLVRSRADRRRRWRFELVRSAPLNPDVLAVRRPTTTALRGRRVLVVGVGTLGSNLATELARAGIGALELVDADLVDPATSCRQTAPVTLAGLPKAWAVCQVIGEDHPYTQVSATRLHVGSVSTTTESADAHRHLIHLVKDADLVLDTAAAPDLSRYLHAICAVTATTFLHASATAGGHGGVVVRIRPGTTEGCWGCLQHHRADHTLPFPPAAEDTDATVVPVGCGEPTFTGTGADLATVATHAARIAITTLAQQPPDQAGTETGNFADDFAGDVHVAALRDQHGQPIPVTWTSHPLTRHPDCRMASAHPAPDAPIAPPGPRADRARRLRQDRPARRHPARTGSDTAADRTILDNSSAESATQARRLPPRCGTGPESGPTRR